jgi:UDP-sulfoquinovose synthase
MQEKATVIFGADGYIGWPLAVHLGTVKSNREKIILVDNFATRELVSSVKSDSLVPIRSMEERIAFYKRAVGKDNLLFVDADARDSLQVDELISKFKPESIVHLAQQRSAPFSMIDQEHALYTQVNNLLTNMNIIYSMARHVPQGHLLKMGSMGEYGTPGFEITEGPIEIERNGKKSKVMFPRDGQSWYHLSKTFDTHNIVLANRAYKIRATDVMQGVVYGTKTSETSSNLLATRFDFDSIWGTVINKYVVQSVLLNKLLIYGKGKQTRGFLSLYDSINCLTLLLNNPPAEGEYRVVNQIDEVYDTLQLANIVEKIAREFGIVVEIERVPNPRVEKEDHYYEVEHKILLSLGFKKEKKMDDVLREIFQTVIANKNRAEKMKNLIYPTVNWRSTSVFRSEVFPMPRRLMYPPMSISPLMILEQKKTERKRPDLFAHGGN